MAVTFAILAPGLQIIRVQGVEMVESVLGAFEVAAVVFAPDVSPSHVLGLSRSPSSVKCRSIRRAVLDAVSGER